MLARSMPLGDFLQRLCDESEFFERVSALHDGMRRRRNLQLVCTLGGQYPGSFHEFIQNAQQYLRAVEAPPAQSETQGAAVQLMTIHKSKGLEFPVVILCGIGKAFNEEELKRDDHILFHRKLGIGMGYRQSDGKWKGETLPHAALVLRTRQEDRAEEMRLLYVALTRAQEKLLLIGCVKDVEKACLKIVQRGGIAALQRGSSYLDWLLAYYLSDSGTLNAYLPAALARPQSEAMPLEIVTAQTVATRFAREANAPLPAAQLQAQLGLPVQADAQWNALRTWQYAHRQSEGLPAKVSATSLLDGKRNWRAPTPAPPPVELPRFLQPTTLFDAMERGSIVHTVLQYLPLQIHTEQQVRALALDLQQRNLLPPGAAAQLDVARVMDFVHSQLYARMQKSPLVKREEPFVLALRAREVFPGETSEEEVLVQGIIDCCFLENGAWVLVDYKTNRVDAQHRPADILQLYRPQLQMYRQALTQISGIPVAQTCLYLVAAGLEVTL